MGEFLLSFHVLYLGIHWSICSLERPQSNCCTTCPKPTFTWLKLWTLIRLGQTRHTYSLESFLEQLRMIGNYLTHQQFLFQSASAAPLIT